MAITVISSNIRQILHCIDLCGLDLILERAKKKRLYGLSV